MLFVRTTAAFISRMADACYGCERTVDQTNHLSYGNILRGARKKVTAMLAATALKVTCGFQLHQDLLKEFDRQIFF